jgi:hypothetical protein
VAPRYVLYSVAQKPPRHRAAAWLVSGFSPVDFHTPPVAAASIFLIVAGLAALIGFQRMAQVVSAAAWIACINGWTASLQSHGLRLSTIAVQWAELGVGVVEITRLTEIAGTITAQVVALRGHGAIAVSARGACWRRCCSGVSLPRRYKYRRHLGEPLFPLRVLLLIVAVPPL